MVIDAVTIFALRKDVDFLLTTILRIRALLSRQDDIQTDTSPSSLIDTTIGGHHDTQASAGNDYHLAIIRLKLDCDNTI